MSNEEELLNSLLKNFSDFVEKTSTLERQIDDYVSDYAIILNISKNRKMMASLHTRSSDLTTKATDELSRAKDFVKKGNKEKARWCLVKKKTIERQRERILEQVVNFERMNVMMKNALLKKRALRKVTISKQMNSNEDSNVIVIGETHKMNKLQFLNDVLFPYIYSYKRFKMMWNCYKMLLNIKSIKHERGLSNDIFRDVEKKLPKERCEMFKQVFEYLESLVSEVERKKNMKLNSIDASHLHNAHLKAICCAIVVSPNSEEDVIKQMKKRIEMLSQHKIKFSEEEKYLIFVYQKKFPVHFFAIKKKDIYSTLKIVVEWLNYCIGDGVNNTEIEEKIYKRFRSICVKKINEIELKKVNQKKLGDMVILGIERDLAVEALLKKKNNFHASLDYVFSNSKYKEICKKRMSMEVEKGDDNFLSKFKKCFVCKLSGEIMNDPYILSESGNSYEKLVLENYLKENDNDPISGEKLQSKEIVRNNFLREAILKWKTLLKECKDQK